MKQLIDCAPKDGTPIRVYGNTIGGIEWSAIAWWVNDGFRNQNCMDHVYPYSPTHWEPVEGMMA